MILRFTSGFENKSFMVYTQHKNIVMDKITSKMKDTESLNTWCVYLFIGGHVK